MDKAVVTEPEQRLREQLVCTIEEALDEMLRCERVEPGLLSLIAGADAAIRALNRRRHESPSVRGQAEEAGTA
jgi:hypothetical protein